MLIQILFIVITIRVIDVNEFPVEFASEFFSFLVRRGIGNVAGQVNVSMSKCTLMTYIAMQVSAHTIETVSHRDVPRKSPCVERQLVVGNFSDKEKPLTP